MPFAAAITGYPNIRPVWANGIGDPASTIYETARLSFAGGRFHGRSSVHESTIRPDGFVMPPRPFANMKPTMMSEEMSPSTSEGLSVLRRARLRRVWSPRPDESAVNGRLGCDPAIGKFRRPAHKNALAGSGSIQPTTSIQGLPSGVAKPEIAPLEPRRSTTRPARGSRWKGSEVDEAIGFALAKSTPISGSQRTDALRFP